MIAVVDAGPLYAAVDADDDDHIRCLEVLQRADLDLVVPALVVAEVTYVVGRRLGAEVESAFLRGLGTLEVEAPIGDDWPAIAELVLRYGNFPLGGTDASVAVLADASGLTSSSRSIDAISERSVRRAVAPTGSFPTKTESMPSLSQAWRSRRRRLR
jgi:predicted nucleic acid-binding protein